MKTKKMILYYVLMFLPLAVTLFALQYLPDQIPAHYDFNQQVTRWGSKYEALIFPILSMGFGGIMRIVTKFAAKQEDSGTNNEKVCITAGILGLVLFNAMSFYYLYTSYKQVENLSSVCVDIYQIMIVLLGLFFVVIGNIMPKVRMNSVLGLRTTWSMKNEITWKKSQRFGGITFILIGIAMILTCFLTKGISCFLISMGLLLASLPIDIYYTYRVAKQQDRVEF